MKKTYVAPVAEKLEFDYTNVVADSNSVVYTEKTPQTCKYAPEEGAFSPGDWKCV